MSRLLAILCLMVLVPGAVPAARKTGAVLVASVPSSGGSVTGGGTYFLNQQVYLTAYPAPGYAFLNWSDGSYASSRTVVAKGTKTYTANFVPVNPTATVWAVSLAWDPVMDYPAAGYRLAWGGQSRTYTNSSLTTMTTAKVDGLPSGTYYFAVAYYTATGAQSQWSNEVTVNAR